jgi:hypothetical protein
MIGNTSISPTADWKKFGALEKKQKFLQPRSVNSPKKTLNTIATHDVCLLLSTHNNAFNFR